MEEELESLPCEEEELDFFTAEGVLGERSQTRTSSVMRHFTPASRVKWELWLSRPLPCA